MYLGFGAVAATGIGAAVIATQYVRGAWPFKDVRENQYVITCNAITEKPAKPLRQGVNTFISPFVRIVEKEGKPAVISGEIQTNETPEFVYRSAEGAQIKLKHNTTIR